MPIIRLPGMPNDKASNVEILDHVAVLQKTVEWILNGNLDTANAFEFGGWKIKNNRLYSEKGKGVLQVYDETQFLRLEAGAYDTEKHHYGIRITSPNSQFVLNEYGFNPAFIKYYKNLTYNSSFEKFDANNKPFFWDVSSGVVATADASFFGTYSLKIPAGGTAEQTFSTTIGGATAIIPPSPAWWGGGQGRISFMKKFGAIKVEVIGDGTPLVLTLPDGTTTTHWEIPANTDWTNGRFTCGFAPAGKDRVWIKYTNTDGSAAAYIDSVQMEPDFTGEWASFYTDGPRSTGAEDGASGDEYMEYASAAWSGSGVTFTLENGYTAEPIVTASVQGSPSDFASASFTFVIEHIQESIHGQLLYSRVKVTPKGSAVPTPSGAKITFHAVCSGRVNK